MIAPKAVVARLPSRASTAIASAGATSYAANMRHAASATWIVGAGAIAWLAASRDSTVAQSPSAPTVDEAFATVATERASEQFEIRRRIRVGLLPPPPVVPSTDIAGLNEVDAFIIAAWERENLPESFLPPEVCDDATFLRRVYLDVIGRIPTMDEASAFLNDTTGDKRSQLVDDLLARDQDYADHWTAFWEDALGSSITGVNAGMATRGNYTKWINDSFRANKPFDLFVAELLDPTQPGYQPVQIGSDNGRPVRINFVLNETHTDTLQSAAAVAQVFMGTAMKCASCHNHFENEEWPQKRFLSFASMFAANDVEVIRCESKTGEFARAMFPFEIPGAPNAMPATERDRLTRVSQLLIDPLNPRFAKSIVNRLWKRYLGLGLFEPIDDYRENMAVSHPELLEWLAQDFMRHDYDLKRTIRLILTSRTYQLRFDPALADSFDSANPGAMRHFRSPTLRRLTAEQFLDSASVAMRQRLDSGDRAFRDTASTTLTRALAKPAVRNDISTARSDEPAILQALEFLNGEEYQRLASAGTLTRVALNRATPSEAADLLEMATLSRPADTAQREALASYLTGNWRRSDDAGAPIETIWLDDDAPEGATIEGEWRWIDGTESPAKSGRRSHTQGGMTAPRSQHLFRVSPGWTVDLDDVLIAWVYIDPANPPREIMLQWNDGTGNDGGWAHRAFWGEDVIPFGMSGTSSRRRLGDLPKTGEWVRLEIPARDVGLGDDATRIVGMSFDQAGGDVRWDAAGATSWPTTPSQRDVQDVLWALFTSVEFQYIK